MRAASKIVRPSNWPHGPRRSAEGAPVHLTPSGFARSSSWRIFMSQNIGEPPYGFLSTLAHHMCSWPLEKVQVDLQAIVQLWQAMQRLMLKTNANCRSGNAASYGKAISRPSCQLWTRVMG